VDQIVAALRETELLEDVLDKDGSVVVRANSPMSTRDVETFFKSHVIPMVRSGKYDIKVKVPVRGQMKAYEGWVIADDVKVDGESVEGRALDPELAKSLRKVSDFVALQVPIKRFFQGSAFVELEKEEQAKHFLKEKQKDDSDNYYLIQKETKLVVWVHTTLNTVMA